MHVYPRMRGPLVETSLNMTGLRGRVRPMVAWFGLRFVRGGLCVFFVCCWGL